MTYKFMTLILMIVIITILLIISLTEKKVVTNTIKEKRLVHRRSHELETIDWK